jgi:hypothetical protein
VQLFHQVKVSGFLHLPLECRKIDTSRTSITPRATPATSGNWIEQQIQNSGWSRVQTTDCHWSESQEYKVEIGERQLESG